MTEPTIDDRYEHIDAGGWVVLNYLIGIGEQIRITDETLFDRPIEAIVENISSNNMLAIKILTPGVLDNDGYLWDERPFGWLQVNWYGIEVLKYSPLNKVVTLWRTDGKTWMLQGPFEILLERETNEYYFGKQTDGQRAQRVWDKQTWGTQHTAAAHEEG